MPYYHTDCGGKIGLFSRKCEKCGKVWPLEVLIKYPYPSDMELVKEEAPRWLKIVTRLSIVGIVIACMLGILAITGFTPYALGVLIIPVVVVVIVILTSRKQKRGN